MKINSARTRSAFHACTILAAGLLVSSPLTACNAIRGGGGSGGSSTITSDSNETVFRSTYQTKAYTFHDDNTADIYLTDLNDAELTAFFAPNADWSTITGTIVHIHLFLDPKPGKTPIEHTAATASVRYAIVTQGQIGIYDGAGFMLPGKAPGSNSISGTIKSAPIRLTRSTERFVDQLIAARSQLTFDASLDASRAAELRARVDALAAKAKPVHD